MSRSEEIAEFVEDSGGIASAAQIAKAGFLPGSISYALESGAIDKLTRGVYCLPEVFDDEFAAISYRWSKCVLSHGSALYLAGLSDRVPAAIDVTVPRGYNPRGLTREYPDTKIHRLPNMSRALSRDKFGQTPCFSGPGLIIWPASLPRWTCLDRRASSQSNIRGFAGRAAAASDRRGSPPRALYVAGVASQFVATAGGVTFGLKSLPAGVPREQRPRE